MLKISQGRDAEVLCMLENMEAVRVVYRILGEYSFFVIIRAKDKTNLDSLINAIRENPNVIGVWHLLVSNDDK